MTPPTVDFRREGMHRLIPSRWSPAGTVLADVANDPAMLEDMILLDGATNDRVQGELHGGAGISTYELVYGIPHAQIVNAAFTHAGEFGARFNGNTRGAWYAAAEVETCIAEVAYHKARRLAEIVDSQSPTGRPSGDLSTYDDWQADFDAPFHRLTPARAYADCLAAEPVPQCYAASQRLARTLLEQQSNGVLYPSVRRARRLCLACFRPALVYHPRPGGRWEIVFTASARGYDHSFRAVAA